MKIVLVLTAANLLGFIMIGPFTPYTLFIGVQAGLVAIVYGGVETLNQSRKTPTRVLTGLLSLTNVYILYLSIRLL